MSSESETMQNPRVAALAELCGTVAKSNEGWSSLGFNETMCMFFDDIAIDQAWSSLRQSQVETIEELLEALNNVCERYEDLDAAKAELLCDPDLDVARLKARKVASALRSSSNLLTDGRS